MNLVLPFRLQVEAQSIIVRDRHKTTSDHVLPDFRGATFEAVLEPIVSRDSVLVTDGRPSYGTFAHER